MSTLAARLARVANLSTCRLTHHGRRTGRAYEVTIWFLVDGEAVYLVTANRTRQWVRNLCARPRVALRMGGETFTGEAAAVTDAAARAHVGDLVADKYWYIRPLLWLVRLVGREAGPDASFRIRLDSGAAPVL